MNNDLLIFAEINESNLIINFSIFYQFIYYAMLELKQSISN